MIEAKPWTARRRGPPRRGADPRPFFGQTLPLALLKNIDSFMAVRGVMTIIVRGKGSWTLRFGDQERPLEPGTAKDADLVAAFVPSAFEAFVQGELEPHRALATGRVKTRGDRRLFARFAQVIDVQPKNLVSARMAAL